MNFLNFKNATADIGIPATMVHKWRAQGIHIAVYTALILYIASII